ncbi:MAG: ABC transporter ATP-binding protein [Bdellovibrionaceae bacterium]|nr:ABC transporter ATP-binding protein [Pseudobdellovibrionaceae bacterium]
MTLENILEIKNLRVDFKTNDDLVHAVKGISFNIPKGTTVGLVGESGSGKSVTSLSVMQLIPNPPGEITGGEILFEGKNLVNTTNKEMRKIRGNRISMIFQEPMTSLNPVFTVGEQISETIELHQNLNEQEAREKTLALLEQVGIPDPKSRIESYPHEMSGGQRQRVMIAMAIACEPDLLIADEPTTALDVTIQKQILELLADLQKQYGMSILFITHDLGVIGDIADEVVVMYRGDIVEQGKTYDIFNSPQHPYTKGLLACRPSLDKNPLRLPTVSDFMTEEGKEIQTDFAALSKEKVTRPVTDDQEVILEIKNVSKHFTLKKNIFGQPTEWIKAVNDISFKVRKGRTLGLVGESGCGKTTLGRSIIRLVEPTSGEVIFNGQDLVQLSPREMKNVRKKLQIIFQDPYASLNPRMTIGSAIMEPMAIHSIGKNRSERLKIASDLMDKVGLSANMLNRYPHEFSGGQRQRICIARALAVKPDFIICDEAVSALDVSIQAQILNLLLDLQEEFNLTYIFISHDLSVVKFFADELIVMNNGEIVEMSDALSIYQNPKDDYTKKLLNAIPKGLPKDMSRQ